MKPILLNSETVVGAISLEEKDGQIIPWRILHEEKDFYTPDLLSGVTEIPAGVRIRFTTNSDQIAVHFAASQSPLRFDLFIDRQFVKTIHVEPQQTSFTLDHLSPQDKLIEIYLSQLHKIELESVLISQEADWQPDTTPRKKWITYGSSITQCCEVESPSLTWPVLTANELNLDLTCLGFSGQCQYEPMIARTIRDTPADFISLCAGINTYGGNCYNVRTFLASIIGFIKIVREKHKDIPIVLSSPIYCPFGEDTPNLVGYTLVEMRKHIEEIVHIFNKNGDDQLFYVDGLDIFGKTHAHLLPDDLHPNTEGYRLMANNFIDVFKQYVN